MAYGDREIDKIMIRYGFLSQPSEDVELIFINVYLAQSVDPKKIGVEMARMQNMIEELTDKIEDKK